MRDLVTQLREAEYIDNTDDIALPAILGLIAAAQEARRVGMQPISPMRSQKRQLRERGQEMLTLIHNALGPFDYRKEL